jgi:hypothetical protein
MDDDGHQISYLALPKGTPVHTSEGALFGTVLKVQDNVREHIFDGLVVRTPAGDVFVDAPEVVRITERRVTLSIDSAEARALPQQPGTSGATETHATRTGPRWKRWFGR